MAGYPNAIEELRASYPALIDAAEQHGDMPPLFPAGYNDGDLPMETMSGIAGDSLADLDWRAKLIVAAEGNRPKAVGLLSRFSEPDGVAYVRNQYGNTAVVVDAMNDAWAAVERATRGRPEWDNMTYGTFTGGRITASAGSMGEYDTLFGAGAQVVTAAGGSEYEALYGNKRVAASNATDVAPDDPYTVLFGGRKVPVVASVGGLPDPYEALYGKTG